MWSGFGKPRLPGEKRTGEAPRVMTSPVTGEVLRAESDEEMADKVRKDAQDWKEAA